MTATDEKAMAWNKGYEDAMARIDVLTHESAINQRAVHLINAGANAIGDENVRLRAEKKELEALIDRAKVQIHIDEQILAQALGGFPWYMDDQKNFPGTTEEDGVCIGELVLSDLVQLAANRIDNWME